MKWISEELVLILNLRNTALDHKKYCEHNCNVSLMQLKLAARYIAKSVPERDEANKYIEEMPIT